MPRWPFIVAQVGNGFLIFIDACAFAGTIHVHGNPRVVFLMCVDLIVAFITLYVIRQAARWNSEESRLQSAIREAESRQKLSAFGDA